MLEFNVGEVVTRLRAAFGVRGRMPLGLDEHLVATVATGDVTVPPWRRAPVRLWGSLYVLNSTATQKAACFLQFKSATPGAAFVLDTLVLSSGDFITATGADTGFRRALAKFFVSVPGQVLGGTGAVALFQTENYPPSTAFVGSTLELTPATTANSTPVITSQLNSLGVFLIADEGRDVQYAPGMILRPSEAILFNSEQSTDATNTSAMMVSVSGLLYPSTVS